MSERSNGPDQAWFDAQLARYLDAQYGPGPGLNAGHYIAAVALVAFVSGLWYFT